MSSDEPETGDDLHAIALGDWADTFGDLFREIEAGHLIGIVYLTRPEGDDSRIQLGRAGIGNYETMIRDALTLDGARDPGTRN